MPLTQDQVKMAHEAHPFLSMGVWKDGTIFVNFNLDLTLRCDGGCRDCMKLLGLLPIDSHGSDFTREHVDLVAGMLKRCGIKMRRLRVTGGEPLMHPDFKGMFEYIKQRWEPIVIRVYTNGRHPLPWGNRYIGAIMRPMPMDKKRERHMPFYLSPRDLGIAPVHGFLDACCIINGCGRSVDAYGFSPCLQYPGIGRLLGRDLHYGYPRLLGDPEICQHCICSQPKHVQKKLRWMVKVGEIEYPTKTWREGIERERRDPVVFARFEDRVKELA